MKVLIASVPAGSGHVRAAEALWAACRISAPDVEAVHVQITDHVSAPFRRMYVDGYRLTVNHAPSLWGKIYDYWDHQSPGGKVTPLLHEAQRFCSGGFYTYLNRFRPDLILTTHFLIPQLLSARHGRRAAVQPMVESIITDFDVHRFWVSDSVSRYYVAHEGLVERLEQLGVPSSRVTASGIPVHPGFSERYSPSAILNSLGLKPDVPVILLLAGGYGLNQLEEAVRCLCTIRRPLQLITVCGHNSALRQRLNILTPRTSIKLVNLGYVRNMPELLTISDLVMTKPGGLSISECLAKQKLMILFPAIPGQEEKNADFLMAHGAAVRVQSFEELAPLANRLLMNPAWRDRLLLNVARYSRPRAAFTIAETLSRTASLAA